MSLVVDELVLDELELDELDEPDDVEPELVELVLVLVLVVVSSGIPVVIIGSEVAGSLVIGGSEVPGPVVVSGGDDVDGSLLPVVGSTGLVDESDAPLDPSLVAALALPGVVGAVCVLGGG